MKRILNKTLLVIIVVIITAAMLLSGCESTNSRVQEALEKMQVIESVHMKGEMDAEVEVAGEKMGMKSDFDMTIEDEENIAMVMKTNSAGTDITMEIYTTGDEMYMYIGMPPLLDLYLDASSMYEEMKDEMAMDMTIFDFDVEHTELEAEKMTIKLDGEETEVLKIKVLLDENQLSDIIKSLFSQMNLGTDTLAGQAMEEATDMYESMEVESAEYTLYIDDNNDVRRYSVSTVFSIDMNGQEAAYDMDMEYDVIETGDSVKVQIPDFPEDQLMDIEDLMMMAEQ